MNKPFTLPMEETSFKEDARRDCRLKDALDLASAHIAQPDAWLLAEAPAGFIWGKFSEKKADPLLQECLFVAIFNPNAEMRFNRAYGESKGICRLLCQDAAAKPTLTRYSTYILRGKGERLRFAEHFALSDAATGNPQGESGSYKLKFSRFCGVEK